jgi:hypothetical protein
MANFIRAGIAECRTVEHVINGAKIRTTYYRLNKSAD